MSGYELKLKSKVSDPGTRYECSCGKWQDAVPQVGHAGWLTARARMRVLKKRFAKHLRTAHRSQA